MSFDTIAPNVGYPLCGSISRSAVTILVRIPWRAVALYNLPPDIPRTLVDFLPPDVMGGATVERPTLVLLTHGILPRIESVKVLHFAPIVANENTYVKSLDNINDKKYCQYMKNAHKKYLEKRQREHERMREMRKNGATLQEIADAFGVSRQRAHQVLQKKTNVVKH